MSAGNLAEQGALRPNYGGSDVRHEPRVAFTHLVSERSAGVIPTYQSCHEKQDIIGRVGERPESACHVQPPCPVEEISLSSHRFHSCSNQSAETCGDISVPVSVIASRARSSHLLGVVLSSLGWSQVRVYLKLMLHLHANLFVPGMERMMSTPCINSKKLH